MFRNHFVLVYSYSVVLERKRKYITIELSTVLAKHGNSLACNRGADKSLARPTPQCILFGGEKISFDANLYIYI